MRDEQGFFERCEEVRKTALSLKNPLIVHHLDCDGLSSASIACSAFIEKNRKYRTLCIKKLDDFAIEKITNEKEIVFVDLGGGNTRVNELKDVVIIDHHQTQGIEKLQANPMLFGIDGGMEISAAGVAYSVFKLRPDLAVVGALGDMQMPLAGMNRQIASEGVKSRELRIENDICFYGRYARSLTQFLLYSDDPYIPGVFYNEERVLKLYQDLGISLKDEEGGREYWRKYCDLSDDERRRLISALVNLFADRGEQKKAEQLICEAYVLPKQDKESETYEANEFSTLLNACGRHDKSEIGIRICLGEKNALEDGRALLQLHRTMLKQGVEFAGKNMQDMGSFYFIDARGIIDEGIVGTVCGMLLRPGMKKPLFGVALGENNTLKWSVRLQKMLKINGGEVLRNAAADVGGIGGGHRVAAGASIPRDKINEFLLGLGRQLGSIST